MEYFKIPYKETRFFSNIILDYLEEKEQVTPFYHRFPTLENFKEQIKEKSNSFSLKNRKVLVDCLQLQNKNLKLSQATQQHIESLSFSTTFTITTGHQLNLFSGPLYFLYKIISVINLCKELKENYPEYNFVPMYWMASEDHDFEEIQYFNFKNQKINWDKNASGAVGRLSTEGLEVVFQEFSKVLNSGKNANELRELFQKSYLEHTSLTEASRYLVNELFGDYGLVIIDGDDKSLKKVFQPYALKELEEQVSFNNVSQTNIKLKGQGYKVQVNPREINLFYVGDGFRERIVKEEDVYKVLNTDLVFLSAVDLFKNADKLEFVSGNALLRPLYQEVVLPNLCYIGGGGELAYWMQLKSTFSEFNVPFPMLLLRNSALLINHKQYKKAEKLSITIKDLFLPQNDLIRNKVKEYSKIDFDFGYKRTQLEQMFQELEILTTQTDKSFIGAVKAQKKKQLKGLDNLEKRLLKAEKIKMTDEVIRIKKIQEELFPNQSLEERQRNFSEYYEEYGESFIADLFECLKPLNLEFTVIKY